MKFPLRGKYFSKKIFSWQQLECCWVSRVNLDMYASERRASFVFFPALIATGKNDFANKCRRVAAADVCGVSYQGALAAVAISAGRCWYWLGKAAVSSAHERPGCWQLRNGGREQGGNAAGGDDKKKSQQQTDNCKNGPPTHMYINIFCGGAAQLATRWRTLLMWSSCRTKAVACFAVYSFPTQSAICAWLRE